MVEQSLGSSAVADGTSQTPWTREYADSTVVLINPIGNDARCWQFLDIENASAFEYPGHGSRPRQPGWTQESFADDIVEHFDGPLDLVGMSMGGGVVAHVLTRHPSRVRSAVIACSGSVGQAAMTAEKRAFRKQRQLDRGRRALEEGMAGIVAETIARWFTPWAVRTQQRGVQYATQTLLDMDPEAWNDIWMGNANSDAVALDDLRNVRAPVTIIGGLNDAAAGLSGLTELHGLIENSRYEVVAGPHMLHLERPENLLAALDRHFAWAPIGNRVEQALGVPGWSNISVAKSGSSDV
jgi:pimeloyl-ACP methyl ester carboxylesterase